MPVPDHLHRFWCALDDLFDRVRTTWWGAVVTDARYPAIWDVNYARVDAAVADLTAADVEFDLLPALTEAGARVFHVVSFHPDETTLLMTELSRRGQRIGWDLVMELGDDTRVDDPGPEVEELAAGQELWSRVEASLALFGIEDADAVAQLIGMERDVLSPGGKRWFCVRDGEGVAVSLAGLVVLKGVGYLDTVATFPTARGRGYASALTARLCREARAAGAAHVSLFADLQAPAVISLYERLGFRRVGMLGSTKGPIMAHVSGRGGQSAGGGS